MLNLFIIYTTLHAMFIIYTTLHAMQEQTDQ